ncbi:MAG: hypothetical protein DCC55_21165 [Chloroflexi bacterium]|nr:MAG: hypothetical protein DCC55_21165 [Chloroflexota bacterium]
MAVPKNLALSSLCSGQTTPGSTAWQPASGGIMVSVGTASCAYAYLPTYLTSLGGSAGQWLTTGANAIYDPALSSFSACVRYWDGSALTPAQANANNWHLNWLALTGNTSVVRKY